MWLTRSPFLAIEPRAYRKDEITDILQKTGRVKNASRRSLAFWGLGGKVYGMVYDFATSFHDDTQHTHACFCCGKEQKMERIWNGMDWT